MLSRFIYRLRTCQVEEGASHVHHVGIKEKDGHEEPYLYLGTTDGLLTCVQMGTIEFHGWGARIEDIEKADRLVFDLDPDEGLDFEAVRKAAFHFRDVLKSIALETFPMVTAGTAFHLSLVGRGATRLGTQHRRNGRDPLVDHIPKPVVFGPCGGAPHFAGDPGRAMTVGAPPPLEMAKDRGSGDCDQPWPAPRLILVGTAGWSIPKTAADEFPSAGSHLQRYAAVLPAVEINSSFHRAHRRSTYERWAASVPSAFRFSVKVPKEISHKARLVDCGELLETFLDQVGGLGRKLDVLLLQLPPSFGFDDQVASSFFTLLRETLDPAVNVACEPRHASWFAGDANACLVRHKVARVLADPVLVHGGERPGGWLGMTYRRLHGTPRVYHSAYAGPMNLEIAQAVSCETTAVTSSWCVFDNTASGAAAGDALYLCEALKTDAREKAR